MLSSHDRIALVHAVFGSIAGLFVLPAAVLLGRYGRASPQWWRAHALLNVVGVLLIVITFALGMASVGTAGEGTQFSGDEADVHHKLGLAILLIVLAQCVFGCAAHIIAKPKTVNSQDGDTTPEKGAIEVQDHAAAPSFSHRALGIRYTHIAFGIITLALVYWCIWNGMHTEWASMSEDHSVTPEAVQVLFWLCVLLAVFAYVLRAGSDILSRVEYTRVALI